MANEEYNEVKRIEGHQEITEIAFLKPIARDKDTMTYQICIMHIYSSEIRDLSSTKCSSKTLQNLLYFLYKKTHIIFFIFCNFTFFPFINECKNEKKLYGVKAGAGDPGGPGGAGPPLESRIYVVNFLKIVKI